jgi:HK97 family phage portal protein
MARQMVGSMIATEEFSASHFKNSACPSGVLEHTQTISDHDKFRLDWDKLHRGTKNTGKIAILEKGLTFKQMSLTPEQSQFLGTRKFLRDEIAGWFNVPPHMIGDLEHATFSNIEHQSLAFVKNCLTPWIVKLEQTMRQKLLMPSEKGKYFIKFNLDALLRGDYETRMKGYTWGIQNGFMCPNDIRRLENMNEIPDELGGNKFLINGNMSELKDAGAAYRKSSEETNSNE